jgi:hypothetical protein
MAQLFTISSGVINLLQPFQGYELILEISMLGTSEIGSLNQI